MCRTCSTIIFPHSTNQILNLWRWRCRCRCRLLKLELPIIYQQNLECGWVPTHLERRLCYFLVVQYSLFRIGYLNKMKLTSELMLSINFLISFKIRRREMQTSFRERTAKTTGFFINLVLFSYGGLISYLDLTLSLEM